MTGNTDMHLLVKNTLKIQFKGRGIDQKTSKYLVPHAARNLLRIELIRLLIVASQMLSHSSSMAVAGYWRELEHAVIHVDPEHPKHAQWVTCLVIMQAMEVLGHFQLPGIVYRSL